MRNMKYLAAAFALLFALSVNVAPAMASSHDKDKSAKVEQQDKNQDKSGDKDRKKDKKHKKDKNKADKKDDKKKKHSNKNNQDD